MTQGSLHLMRRSFSGVMSSKPSGVSLLVQTRFVCGCGIFCLIALRSNIKRNKNQTALDAAISRTQARIVPHDTPEKNERAVHAVSARGKPTNDTTFGH